MSVHNVTSFFEFTRTMVVEIKPKLVTVLFVYQNKDDVKQH